MHVFDFNNVEDRDTVKEFYENLFYGKTYRWFHERTGLENWVLFREDQFIIDTDLFGRKFLHYYGNPNGVIEAPLGVSSCYYMFSDNVTGPNVNLATFYREHIIDTRNMFFNNYVVENIDLSLVDLNSLECADFMFAVALNLHKISFQKDLIKFPHSTRLFMGCKKLKEINNDLLKNIYYK